MPRSSAFGEFFSLLIISGFLFLLAGCTVNNRDIEMVENARAQTDRFAGDLSGEERSFYKAETGRKLFKSDVPGLIGEELIFDKPPMKVTISCTHPKPSSASSGLPIGDNDARIDFQPSDGASFPSKIISLGGPAFSEYFAVDVFGKFIFIVWKNDANEGTASVTCTLNLKVLEMPSGTETFSGIIHTQKYGITNPDIVFSPASSLLLLTWNDISRHDSESLLFAGIPLSLIASGNPGLLAPESIFLKDRWDKLNPRFHRVGEEIFLSLTTGEHWGAFAYKGKKCIGIARIDGKGKPSEYGIIATENAISTRVLVKDRKIIFEILDPVGSKVSQVKKIEFNDVYKVPE